MTCERLSYRFQELQAGLSFANICSRVLAHSQWQKVSSKIFQIPIHGRTTLFHLKVKTEILLSDLFVFVWFDLILYLPSTIFQLCRYMSSWVEPVLLFVCLFCCFTSQVSSYGHDGTASSPNHIFSWAGLNKQLVSSSCTYFHL